AQLARRFDVSLGWAKKVSAVWRATGKIERPPGWRRGPVSKVTAEIEQDLRSWVGKQADLTLAELQLRLYQQRNFEISIGRLWRALRHLGLRLKKSRYTPPSRIPPRGSSGAVSGVKKSAKSIRRN